MRSIIRGDERGCLYCKVTLSEFCFNINMPSDNSKFDVPSRTMADHGYAAIRAAISAIPVAGGPAVEVLAAVIRAPIEKRRDEWMAAVSGALTTLDRNNRIDLAALSNDPQFIDAILEATQIALRTSKEEKLAALRNAVLNTALRSESDEAIREILLNMIDGLTPIHMEFLKHFKGKCSTSSLEGFVYGIPALKDSPLLYHTIWKDLSDRGLIEGDAAIPTKESPVIYCTLSELGQRFLKFISDPR